MMMMMMMMMKQYSYGTEQMDHQKGQMMMMKQYSYGTEQWDHTLCICNEDRIHKNSLQERSKCIWQREREREMGRTETEDWSRFLLPWLWSSLFFCALTFSYACSVFFLLFFFNCFEIYIFSIRVWMHFSKNSRDRKSAPRRAPGVSKILYFLP